MSVDLGKFELECMRLAADCRQLSNALASPELRKHFLQMAVYWTKRAETGQRTNRDAGAIDKVGSRSARADLATLTIGDALAH